MVAGLKSFPTARTDLIVSIGAVHIRLPVRVLVVGQTLPMDSAPVPPDVRCCAKSDHSRRECEMTRRAMYGRRPRCKRNLAFCEAFGCSHVSGLFLHERVTSIAMQPLWPLALM
jgi:hypothetical protein